MTAPGPTFKSARFGLGFKIKAIVAFLVVLLIAVSGLSYLTLQRFSGQITAYSEQTLPALAASIDLNTSLESVVQNAEQLVSSNVQAQRRIAYGATQDSLEAINTLLVSRETLVDVDEIRTVLTILGETTSELNGLIERRIDVAMRLAQLRQDLGRWVVNDLVSEKTIDPVQSDPTYSAWLDREHGLVQQVTDLSTSNDFRSQQRRLPTIRRSLQALFSTIETLPVAIQPEARSRIESLQAQMATDTGLVVTLRELSQVDVRARALERQMRVLVAELLRKTDSLAHQTSAEAQSTAIGLARQSEQQLAALFSSVIVAVIIAAISFIYIERRVLARLLSLRDAVIGRASGGEQPIPTIGEDEVGEMGKAVQFFVDEIDARQAQLVESAEQTNAIIRLSPQAMCIATENEILYHNDAFEALWSDLATDIDSIKSVALEALPKKLLEPEGKRGVRSLARHAIPGKGGKVRWFNITSNEVEWHGTRARQVIAVDTTNQVQVEHTLEEARRRAEAAAQAKSNFLAMMSHEIRSPMNGIISVGEMLGKSKLDAEQNQLVTVINQSAETLLTILDDVLDLSKIEAGKLDISNHTFELPLLLDGVANLLRQSFLQKEVTFSVDLAEDLPVWVTGDSNRIRQIMYNLLSNALKFTEQGSVSLVATTEKATDDRHTIRIDVSDTGIGINPEIMNRLFQPFEQADSSVARQYGGTGLGLTICQRLANLMGGEISVKSKEGEGSTFTLELPLRIAEKPVEAAAKTETHTGVHASKNGSEKKRILVVEDNKVNQLVIGKILKSLDYEWDTADDGEMALKLFNPDLHGIVLTDLRMPRMDGFALANAIRAKENDGARTPIIAISADAMEEAKDRSTLSGIDRFLTKPVKVDEVRECLEAFG